MTLSGSNWPPSLLYDLHADDCDGTEYTACRPVVLDDREDRGQKIEVVFMAWCGECHAAEWEVV